MSSRPVSRRIQFDSRRGHALAGILDQPAEKTPVGQLIFSHCFTCNKDLKAIVRISRRLAVLGFNVLRFDMTGLGNSGGDFSESNFTTNLDDLSDAAAWMQEACGPVHGLIGHSFGGLASMVFASANCQGLPESRLPESPLPELSGVATIGAPSDTTHLASLLLRMDPAIETHGKGEVEIGGRRWTIQNQMIEDFRKHSAADQIAQLTVPLLVLHSAKDETVSFDHAIRLEGLVRGNPAGSVSVVDLNPADHLLTHSGDPEYVADWISGFMNRAMSSR